MSSKADYDQLAHPKKFEENFKQLSQDISIFKSSKIRTKTIYSLFDPLKSFSPTSVEVERVFFGAGLFVTMIRNSLSNRSVYTLCIIMAYYLRD